MAFSDGLADRGGSRVLKHKMLWAALSIVLSMAWWWLSQSELDQALAVSVNAQPIRIYGSEKFQPLVEKVAVEKREEMPPTEVHQLDEEFVEFKYRNLKRLMSTRIDTLDEYQLEMVVQQIINELPEMVSIGQMHPLDATFAHTQAMTRKNHEFQAREVEAINKKYMDLYPFPINSNLLDLH